MPIMPRPDKKSEKVAWKVLGKPANLTAKETPRQRQIARTLDYQITVDAR